MTEKEQPLYLAIWQEVSKMVEQLPKESVMHITEMVKLQMEREEKLVSPTE